MVNFCSISKDWSLEIIDIFAFKLYIRPLDPVKCLVEEVGSKSGIGGKVI